MTGVPGSPRVLHIHGSLETAQSQAMRCVQLIAAFGGRMRHTMVSDNGRWGALDTVPRGVPVERHDDFPTLSGLPLPGRLQAIARKMVDYHLVLTYGRAGTNAALAHTLFAQLHGLPPLIHHEDGSDESTRGRRGWRSTWSRRLGLGKTAGLVVPTEVMEGEALVRWQQPLGRVKTIRDGVDLEHLARLSGSAVIPRLVKRKGERWIGCSARFQTGEGLAALIDALATTDSAWHLVLAGEGPERPAVAAKIADLGLEGRVHMVSPLENAGALAVLADIVAVPMGSEPLPAPALLAMGAGKPVIGFETGELAAALAPDNAPFVSAPGDDATLATALQQLAEDEFLRRRTGEANRERAVAERDAQAMIASYRRLYASAMGRETI